MTDIIDAAKLREMEDRRLALLNQKDKARQTEQSLFIDDVQCCIDCNDPIQKARIEADVDCVRCISCQEDFELITKRKNGGAR